MKLTIPRILLITLLALALFVPSFSSNAQSETPSTTPDAATPEQGSPARPLIVIGSYYLDQDTITPGQTFKLFISVDNKGDAEAQNLIFTFSGADFLPKETGGVKASKSLAPGDDLTLSQPLVASTSLWGKTNGTVSVTLSYNGPEGQGYTESFTITLDILGWSGNWATATPTPTATALPRAQLVVVGYKTDVDPLQPGSIFNLELDVQNMGSGDARDVSVVLGGGATPSMAETPAPGGVSGGSADLSTFAPLGSSNVQYLGDIPINNILHIKQKLIVNVSANPGAYALKLSFISTDAKGNRNVDDQVITMLIYQIPQVEVNYYRDPGTIMMMQPNTLPIQVVNLGRKPTVMGNMTISAEGADMMNNVSLVGTLEAGGYFPLDVMLIPHNAGLLDVKVVITYTDDFNQPRSVEHTFKINVQEGAPMDPGMGGPGMGGPGMEGVPGMGNPVGPGMEGMPIDMPVVEETFWDKALRFVKGLLGLDSGIPEPAAPMIDPGIMPPGNEGVPVPAPAGKG